MNTEQLVPGVAELACSIRKPCLCLPAVGRPGPEGFFPRVKEVARRSSFPHGFGIRGLVYECVLYRPAFAPGGRSDRPQILPQSIEGHECAGSMEGLEIAMERPHPSTLRLLVELIRPKKGTLSEDVGQIEEAKR